MSLFAGDGGSVYGQLGCAFTFPAKMKNAKAKQTTTHFRAKKNNLCLVGYQRNLNVLEKN